MSTLDTGGATRAEAHSSLPLPAAGRVQGRARHSAQPGTADCWHSTNCPRAQRRLSRGRGHGQVRTALDQEGRGRHRGLPHEETDSQAEAKDCEKPEESVPQELCQGHGPQKVLGRSACR